MLTRTRTQIACGIALAVTAVALATPQARADDWFRDQIPAAGQTLPGERPDDRPDARGPGAAVQASSTRPDDRAGLRGPGAAPADTPAPIVIRPGGFDWGDAGIGAAIATGALMLAGGLSLVARRHRRASVAAL